MGQDPKNITSVSPLRVSPLSKGRTSQAPSQDESEADPEDMIFIAVIMIRTAVTAVLTRSTSSNGRNSTNGSRSCNTRNDGNNSNAICLCSRVCAQSQTNMRQDCSPLGQRGPEVSVKFSSHT